MIRNLKAVGFVAVAILAMSAMGPPLASGVGKFTSASGYPQHLTGAAGGQLTLGGVPWPCEEAPFTGVINAPTTELRINQAFINCAKVNEAMPTFTMNGCEYLFKVTETVAIGHDRGSLGIVCPTEKRIEVHLYSNQFNHMVGMTGCTFTLLPPAESVAATYTDGEGDFVIEGSITYGNQMHGACTGGLTLFGSAVQHHFTMTAATTGGGGVHIG